MDKEKGNYSKGVYRQKNKVVGHAQGNIKQRARQTAQWYSKPNGWYVVDVIVNLGPGDRDALSREEDLLDAPPRLLSVRSHVLWSNPSSFPTYFFPCYQYIVGKFFASYIECNSASFFIFFRGSNTDIISIRMDSLRAPLTHQSIYSDNMWNSTWKRFFEVKSVFLSRTQ